MIEYRNMKKGLIAAGLLVSLSGTAQDVSTYTPGTMGEGVVYYLPKTEIELQVTATKVVYTPGESANTPIAICALQAYHPNRKNIGK